MTKRFLISIFCLLIISGLVGCTVRTYSLTKDRVDQELTGNRGYLMGSPPPQELKEKKATRTTQVVEVELFPPIKFERKPATRRPSEPMMQRREEDKELSGNLGYITGGPAKKMGMQEEVSFERYTVQKGDTLQKISKKFYGTTKKWMKIYQVNQGILKNPNSIYPGQVINIPGEPLKETQENLK